MSVVFVSRGEFAIARFCRIVDAVNALTSSAVNPISFNPLGMEVSFIISIMRFDTTSPASLSVACSQSAPRYRAAAR